MSQGVLVFAFNNEEIDYVALAIYAAKRAKLLLNKPVSLVTDSKAWLLETYPQYADVFDTIIETTETSTQQKTFYDGVDTNERLTWRNSNRATAYDLTPYDETLVIDTDYIINSSFLSYVWDQPHDFLIYNDFNDLAGWRDTTEFNYISEYSIPFYWATVFFFRKTKETEAFFGLVDYIRDNWSYYRALYRITDPKFRNDFAFSIAIHMMNGFTCGTFATPIANKLHYTLDRDILIDQKNKRLKFLVQKANISNDYTALQTYNLDVHVMNKRSLLRVIERTIHE